jgi:peptidoglycan/xylan/chitin deacetylase (PgdA/CDA1 family)
MAAFAEKIQRSIRSLHYSLGIDQQLYRNFPATDVIVMYHNVLPKERSDIHLRHFSEIDFRNQLRYFKKRFHVVPLHKIFESSRHNNRLAITFDDGLINNLRYAAPILAEENVPATFFITTTWLHGESSLWPDRLSILLHYIASKLEFKKEVFHRKNELHFRSERTNKTIQEVLLESSPSDVSQFIQSLTKSTGINPSNMAEWEDMTRIMMGDEIKELAQNPLFEIGSHATTHSNLLKLPQEQVLNELRDSKDYLEKITSKKIDSLAYPFGNYNRDMINLAESLGYTRQLAVDFKHGDDKSDKRIRSRIGLYCDRSFSEQMHQVQLSRVGNS